MIRSDVVVLTQVLHAHSPSDVFSNFHMRLRHAVKVVAMHSCHASPNGTVASRRAVRLT